MVAHWDEWSAGCSRTIRTARSLNSGENLLVFIVGPSSQALEPPPNPGRFILNMLRDVKDSELINQQAKTFFAG